MNEQSQKTSELLKNNESRNLKVVSIRCKGPCDTNKHVNDRAKEI